VRATLFDPGEPFVTSPWAVTPVLGSAELTASPLAFKSFEAELLKQDAGPACGSHFTAGTLLGGRLLRKNNRSTGSVPVEQPSALGCWLDFSIHRFHSELQRLRR